MNTKLPAVLCFPDTKQNSISVLRALKNIKKQLEFLDDITSFIDDAHADKFNAAMDDLDLMINAVE